MITCYFHPFHTVSYQFPLSAVTFIGFIPISWLHSNRSKHNSVDSVDEIGLGRPWRERHNPDRWTGGSSLSVQNLRAPATSGNQFKQILRFFKHP